MHELNSSFLFMKKFPAELSANHANQAQLSLA